MRSQTFVPSAPAATGPASVRQPATSTPRPEGDRPEDAPARGGES
jgi:hypothetical protein